MKLLGGKGPTSDKAHVRFEREVMLVVKLTHPNSACVDDSGLLHGEYCHRMKLMERTDPEECVQPKKPGRKQQWHGAEEQDQLVSKMIGELLVIQVIGARTDKPKTGRPSAGKIPGSRLAHLNKQPGLCQWQRQASVSVGSSA